MKLNVVPAVACVLAVLSTRSADAQFFSTGSLASFGQNVENTGTLLEAVNFYSTTDSTAASAGMTLNGVTFTGTTAFSGANFSTNATEIDSGLAGGVPSVILGGVSTPAPVYALVTDGSISTNGMIPTADVQTLTLTGLTPGETYSAQMFFDSADTRETSLTDGAQASATITAGPNDGPAFITDTFVASGVDHTITINPDPLDAAGAVAAPLALSGFVVDQVAPQAVPEPAPLTLLTLGFGVVLVMGVHSGRRFVR